MGINTEKCRWMSQSNRALMWPFLMLDLFCKVPSFLISIGIEERNIEYHVLKAGTMWNFPVFSPLYLEVLYSLHESFFLFPF